jgi:hypothetical protein
MKTASALLLSLTLAAPVWSETKETLPPPPGGFTLHEWGTFTSVSGSDGVLLPGVERSEEALPSFTYAHEAMHHNNSIAVPFSKGIAWQRPLANVTVRMETPVIYFYTREPFQAQVEVGFKGGTISQWYPQRSGGESLPALKRNEKGLPLQAENTLDFAKGYNGSIAWDVKVEPPGPDAFGRVFRGGETPGWLHPRQPDSALVSTKDGETEKYLFYRGLGRLDPPVRFMATDTTLKVVNGGAELLQHYLIFDMNGKGEARWMRPVPVPAMKDFVTPLPGHWPDYRADWQKPLYENAAMMLTLAGLTRQEADGMLQTWWSSYFGKPGLRVFWVVPAGYVNEVLPLKVTPAPRETVRVILGRTEILTPQFEKLLCDIFGKAAQEGTGNPLSGDRFHHAYAHRVKQLGSGLAQKGK